jgi:TonB family protein
VVALLQQQLEGKYEILEKIKEGGMGAVYKVRHRFLDEIRVIKVIRPALEPSQDLSDRFLREARMAIRLRHPSIAVLHDFAVADDGNAFIVMEYIDGLTLEDVLLSGGPPPLGLALEVACQALRAVGYLHRHGFVHRDIAPDNLMLTHGVDGEPLVKLIDLGIAKALAGDGSATSTGMFLGKPRYASPEHFGVQEMDHRSDLYSFGVVFYEMLTGQCPVAGHNPASYMAGHLFRPPLDFAESDPKGMLPPELRRIVLRALAKTPADRFASASDLAREVALLQSRFPVRAGDLEEALVPTSRKTAPWVVPAPAGSSQVLLDRQFLAGTTPPPAPQGGLPQTWDPHPLPPETLPPAVSQPAAAFQPAASPATALPAAVPPPTAHPPAVSAAAVPRPVTVSPPVRPPLATRPNPDLDETLPLTAYDRKPPAPPAAPPRTTAPLAARTLAGVAGIQPPGGSARELPLPAPHPLPPPQASEDWGGRPLHRPGAAGEVKSAPGSPTLGFKRRAPAAPSAAVPEARAPAQEMRRGRSVTWVWVAGALLAAAVLGSGAWWHFHQPGTVAPSGAPRSAPTAPQNPGTAGSTGPAEPAGVTVARSTAPAKPQVPASPPAPAGGAAPRSSGGVASAPVAVAAAAGTRPRPAPAAAGGTDAGERRAPPPAEPAARSGRTPEQRPSAGGNDAAAVLAVPGARAQAPAESGAEPKASRAATSDPNRKPAGTSPAARANRTVVPFVDPAPQEPGVDESAEPVDLPDAIYPAAARGSGKSAKVLLAILVDEKGHVAEVRVKEGDSSHLGFNEAAIEAVRKARFLAATRNGVPVRSWSELMIDFVSPPNP